MKNFLFYLCFAVLTTHELDAVAQSEWKLLYVLRDMPDELAALVFVGLHVPLFAVLLWLTMHHENSIRLRSRSIFATFLIVHAGLHYRLQDNDLYTFDSPLSLTLIFGGALLGASYLIFDRVLQRHIPT